MSTQPKWVQTHLNLLTPNGGTPIGQQEKTLLPDSIAITKSYNCEECKDWFSVTEDVSLSFHQDIKQVLQSVYHGLKRFTNRQFCPACQDKISKPWIDFEPFNTDWEDNQWP